MVSAEFDKQKGILISKFEGKLTLKEVVDYIVATKENKSYPRKLKILTDATKSEMAFKHGDLPIIVEENHKSLEKYEQIIDAIIIESPKETAFSVLYKEMAKTNKYNFSVFSTKEAALQWLEKF
jgi:hypothetical protein